MMIKIENIVQQLHNNAAVIRALVQPISDEQSQWKPDPDTWSMKEVMEHVYNEERIDFRKHLKEMLSDPPQPWGAFRNEDYISIARCHQALALFLNEREASILWLKSLDEIDWDVTSQVTFGPAEEVLILSAGDVLGSWAAHDYLHIRQMNEILYAWHAHQMSPYDLQYAGGW